MSSRAHKENKKELWEYNLDKREDSNIVREVYEEVQDMIDIRNESYIQFNDRNLRQYINDCDKRLNSYAPPKEAQGKEDWQSNVALPTVRDKVKRVIASFSLDVPDLEVEAVRSTGEVDMAAIKRGEISEKMIKSSYREHSNPVLQNFWESWELASKGTIVKYEGHLDKTVNKKIIKEIDYETGKVEFDTVQVDVADKLISHIVPLTEMYISDPYVKNIQDQKAVAWIKYYDQDEFYDEFGKYGKAKDVKLAGGINEDTSSQFYKKHWGGANRAGE